MIFWRVVSLFTIIVCSCSLINGYDIIVYTATASGISAAVTAARVSPHLSIAIIEPTMYIGGMISAGGIGLGDTRFPEVRKFFFSFSQMISYCSMLQSMDRLPKNGY